MSPLPMSSDPTPIGPPPAMDMPMDMGEEPVTPVEPANLAPTQKTETLGDRVFEDFFPPLTLTEEEEKALASSFKSDLLACVRYNNTMRDKWALYRAVFMLEYVEKFYPTSGVGAEYASGLLCDNVLKGMDRLKKAIFSPRPFFVVDDKVSGVQDIDLLHRLEWFQHSTFVRDLKIRQAIGLEGLFDFLLDGSMVMQADQIYEKVPCRSIKSYAPGDEDVLLADRERILEEAEFERALFDLQNGTTTRVLVEQDVITHNGLQVFRVDKQDHLIPPGVFSDQDIRFRARRMYLTRGDLELLASPEVNWYPKDKVEAVLGKRQEMRSATYQLRQPVEDRAHMERLQQAVQSSELSYDWQSQDRLTADPTTLPYQSTFAVYRVLCKYGYKTKKDPKGVIPKYCLFDYEPDSGVILRARTYPHFHEQHDYFHFKLGIMPKSYWGFGFGPRLINEDSLESNAVCLYLDSAAMASFRPFLCVSPEYEDAIVPFTDGFYPAKIGFVKNLAHFKQLETAPPPEGLLRNVIGLTTTRAENRTSLTSLVQGRAESTDPRAPAQKAQMLLKQAYIGIESILEDWNESGWEPLAQFVWKASYERAVYEGKSTVSVVETGDVGRSEGAASLTLAELGLPLIWKSQAASDYLNSEIREATFLRHFQFFAPIIQALAQVSPDLYKKYFVRWMRKAAQEMSVRDLRYLIPSETEINSMSADGVSGIMQQIMEQLKGGQSVQNMPTGGQGGEE